MELVRGKCPRGCGSTLFLGAGGYVTCSWFACPEPDAASTMLLSLGSDETGAKPADVHARISPQPSHLTDSSPSSSEARHGVAQALVEQVCDALKIGRSYLPLFAADHRKVSRANEHLAVILEAEGAVGTLLGLIDEIADRLYAATARLSRLEAELKTLSRFIAGSP